MTDDELAAIEAHAYGGLPPGDGEHYVHALLAEVRRLRGVILTYGDRNVLAAARELERTEPASSTGFAPGHWLHKENTDD
jgi:hypothetical protein